MKKHGRTFGQDITMVRRGVRELERILPGQLRLIALNSIITTLIPYVGIIMSAMIITELTGAREVRKLAIYVALAVGFTLLLTTISSVLKAKIAVGYSLLFKAHEIHLDSKSYDLDYSKIEDPDVRALRNQVSGSISNSGAGMASLYWDIEIVVTHLSSVIIAVILSADIFTGSSPGGFTGVYAFVNSPLAALFLAVLIVISAAVSSKMSSKVFEVIFDVFLHGANHSRYGTFYTRNYLSDDKAAKDVRIFNQREIIIRETLDRCYVPFYNGSKRECKASNRYDGVKLALCALLGGAVYLFVGLKALSGTVGIGSLILVYGAITKLILSLGELSQIITDLRNNNEHLKLYFEYMALPSKKDTGTEEVDFSINPVIRFENVCFLYPGSDTYALRNVNIEFDSNKKLAVVGMNGSGKTTMIKLLCRLYEPTEGRITLNGKDIACFKYDQYLRLFSVVFQDFKLLAFSLGQNVAAASIYDEAHVKKCLDLAGFGERLSSLEKGTEQALYRDFEEEGVDLSGGEEQKIAIARAIYKEAPFVILDEPTAALDPISEYEIYTKFNQIIGSKTAIYISHRLSSCRFCDNIVVFDHGEIVEFGTHEALLRNINGKYFELWSAQAKYYT